MKKGLILLAALLVAGPAFAADRATVDVADAATFSEQRAEILADLADGETYAEITLEDREKVVSTLSRMQRMLGSHESAQALHPDERVALMNEQETINNILSQAHRDSRMVCTRERPVGTRMPTNVCRTVAERRRLREDSRRNLDGAGRARNNTLF